jgi:sigma-B regulation protein RsbU (phosphoserine phosphatase)
VRLSARASHDLFELTVSNSGPPIPAAALEKLFQPFFRREVRASLEGLGLGLHIASEIARAHGGTLQVAFSDDLTTFTLTCAKAACFRGRLRRELGPALLRITCNP